MYRISGKDSFLSLRVSGICNWYTNSNVLVSKYSIHRKTSPTLVFPSSSLSPSPLGPLSHSSPIPHPAHSPLISASPDALCAPPHSPSPLNSLPISIPTLHPTPHPPSLFPPSSPLPHSNPPHSPPHPLSVFTLLDLYTLQTGRCWGVFSWDGPRCI